MRLERERESQEPGHSRFYSTYQAKDFFPFLFIFLEGIEVEGHSKDKWHIQMCIISHRFDLCIDEAMVW